MTIFDRLDDLLRKFVTETTSLRKGAQMENTEASSKFWDRFLQICGILLAAIGTGTAVYVGFYKEPSEKDPCKILPVEERPITCLESKE